MTEDYYDFTSRPNPLPRCGGCNMLAPQRAGVCVVCGWSRPAPVAAPPPPRFPTLDDWDRAGPSPRAPRDLTRKPGMSWKQA